MEKHYNTLKELHNAFDAATTEEQKNAIRADYKKFEKELAYALISRPKEFKFNSFEECIASAKELPDLEEGYVVYVDGVPTVKIKSPQYLH